MSEMISRIGVWVACAMYVTATVLYLAGSHGKKRRVTFAAYAVYAAGCLANAAVICANFVHNGYVPFVSMYQVLSFLSLCFLPIMLYIRFCLRTSRFDVYSFASSAVTMMGPCAIGGSVAWAFPPALQSPWFIPHILMYMIAYSLGTVGFVISVISYFSKDNGNEYDEAACCCARTLFPFMTCGLTFGAIWADQVWGEFWSWDAKECWSLVTWLLYMLALHCFRRAPLKKYAKPLLIAGFVGIIITFFFVKILGGSSTHTYS